MATKAAAAAIKIRFIRRRRMFGYRLQCDVRTNDKVAAI